MIKCILGSTAAFGAFAGAAFAGECSNWNSMKFFTDVRGSAAKQVQDCLESGANPNQQDSEGMRPLDHAILLGDYRSAVVLIDHGAELKSWNRFGETPLHSIVTTEGSQALIAFMLSHGADLEARNLHEETPLHIAARHGPISVVKFLIKHGADVNVQDQLGATPLHEAAALKDDPKVIDLLISAGAEPARRNDGGKTPADLAKTNPQVYGSDTYQRLEALRHDPT